MKQRWRGGNSARWALASTAAGVAFGTSYAMQRLVALVGDEPTFGEVILQVHTPYYWRLSLALLHALLTIGLIGFGVEESRATRWLRWAPIWVPLTLLPFALLMVAFP